MSDWPRHVEACKECTGEPGRYAHGSGEYCNRCYRLLKYIKDVQGWDRNRRESLKHIPKHGTVGSNTTYRDSTTLLYDCIPDEEFEAVREKTIVILKKRLALLRYREEIRRHEIEVTGLRLEEKFAEVLHLVRRSGSFPRYASYLTDEFDERQRQIIYALLEEIIEQVPWQGVHPE
jgi:hypothetical protein